MQARMECKFGIAYMIAKENLLFIKMKAVCELEERHSADLGEGYKNDRGCSVIVEFIACNSVYSAQSCCFGKAD